MQVWRSELAETRLRLLATLAPGLEELPPIAPVSSRIPFSGSGGFPSWSSASHTDGALPRERLPVTEPETQAAISEEIAAISKSYDAAGSVETQPRTDYPPYRSSLLRHPTKDL